MTFSFLPGERPLKDADHRLVNPHPANRWLPVIARTAPWLANVTLKLLGCHSVKSYKHGKKLITTAQKRRDFATTSLTIS